jgi:hypothetical protein
MAGLLLLIRPRRRDLRRSLTLLFTLGLSLAALSSLTGCGNDSSLHLAPKGTATITITAQPSAATTSAQTTTIMLTIQ